MARALTHTLSTLISLYDYLPYVKPELAALEGVKSGLCHVIPNFHTRGRSNNGCCDPGRPERSHSLARRPEAILSEKDAFIEQQDQSHQ